MKRYVSLEEISDGKLYTANDMVKADCLGCQGCSRCCHEMGDTILLDPCDIWRFQKGLGKDAQTLLAENVIALRVVDGVIVPHIKMQPVNTKALKAPVLQTANNEEIEEKCPFLDEQGWCTVHAFRPGFCRLFPLGRYYEGEGFKYFLQKSECDHPKAKVRISKWLDLPDLPKYESFVLTWHQIQKQVEELCQENQEESFGRNLNMFQIKTFYLLPYDGEADFYEQFEKRLAEFRKIVP